jgi:hypothetical protein
LSILRVLSKQTPEINKEVKYSSVLDPRLVKVVKYSTLTILFQFISISYIIFEDMRNCWRLSVERGAFSNGGFDLAFGKEILSRSEWDGIWLTYGDFSWHFVGFLTPISIYYQSWEKFLKQATLGV